MRVVTRPDSSVGRVLMKGLTGLVLAALFMLMLGSTASGDAVYRSERLAFEGGSPAFHGQVVNIHANGPVVGALERYQVVRAAPDTAYEVWIQTCDGGDTFTNFLMTASLVTNGHGNGHAKARFSADDLAPFSGAVIDIRWVLRDGGVEYWTSCTTVTID